MLKATFLGLTAALCLSSTFALAQARLQQRIEQRIDNRFDNSAMSTDWKQVTDERIDLIKAALQLTPDQQKLWPPVEQAIRARGETRVARLKELKDLTTGSVAKDASAASATGKEDRRNFVEIMEERSENLIKRGENLKSLAAAWQPLYQTLNQSQKRRMALLSIIAFREARDMVEERRMDLEDEMDE
jgi:hypothetical protein